MLLQETFERAKAWVKELQRQASPNIVIALAGNKADLAERRLVEFEVSHWYSWECFGGIKSCTGVLENTHLFDVGWQITPHTV